MSGCLRASLVVVGAMVAIVVGAGLILTIIAVATDPAGGSATGGAGAGAAATATPPRAREAARYVDPRLLAGDPKAHVGENVRLTGRALNVEQVREGRDPHTWVNLQAQIAERATTEAVIVRLRPLDATVLGDECYAFYGVVAGTSGATRTLTGARNEVVTVDAYAVEPWPRERFGCKAP